MLFLAKSASDFNALQDRMQSMGKFFKLSLEEASTVSIRYLDVVVKRDGDTLITFVLEGCGTIEEALSGISPSTQRAHCMA